MVFDVNASNNTHKTHLKWKIFAIDYKYIQQEIEAVFYRLLKATGKGSKLTETTVAAKRRFAVTVLCQTC